MDIGLSQVKTNWFLIVVLSVVFTNCNRKTKNVVSNDCTFHFKVDAPFAMGVSDKACNTDLNIQIALDSVFDDSRCPEGVNCIWEGNAKMRSQLKTAKSQFRFDLDTQPTSNFYQHDTTIGGYRISLLQLSPYPVSENKIKQTDYAVEISVSPAS